MDLKYVILNQCIHNQCMGVYSIYHCPNVIMKLLKPMLKSMLKETLKLIFTGSIKKAAASKVSPYISYVNML